VSDKEGRVILSSMRNGAGLVLLLSGSVAAAAAASLAPDIDLPVPTAIARPILPVAASAQSAVPSAPTPAIAASVARWNSLRQTDGLPFSAYSSFLLSHRDWPGEAGLRRAAEQALGREAAAPSEVIRFFSAFPPTTATGHAQHAFALLSSGRPDEARAAARTAWTTGVMREELEQRLLGAFGGALGQRDHDQRMEILLGNGDTQSAARTLAWASAARRPLYEARLALQNRAGDAASRVAALGSLGVGDAGLLIDRAVWMRASGDSQGSRALLAQRRTLSAPPANAEKFMEAMVAIARAAANDRQWSLAYQIASQVDDIFPPGTDVSRRSYGERDEYTNLTWLAGSAALRAGRPGDAAGMFERYGRGAQSPQTRAKGFYWAARAAGQSPQATQWLELAAANHDQFYGQLALERLGRRPAAPAAAQPISAAEREAFAARPLAQATRYLGTIGQRGDQTVFIRALAGTLTTDRERAVASEFGRMIGRLDMGVWAAREARSSGGSFYARAAFPEVAVPPVYLRHRALAHGIMRQESSFERSAVSSAGARGLMQLMPGTARQAASRVGVPYTLGRLTEDPQYNILLGNHHLSELLDEWGGNAVLVAAAYNAGSGNVRRWVRENGDPRLPGADVLRWIEDIPFSETRNYVQRVIENSVVYDMMEPNGGMSGGRASRYLGRSSAP
jgi:soluble lytic murein transglycosylase